MVADNPESEDEQRYLTGNFRNHTLCHPPSGEVQDGLALPFRGSIITPLVLTAHLSKAWLREVKKLPA